MRNYLDNLNVSFRFMDSFASSLLALVCLCAFGRCSIGMAQGIPEPPILFYGAVLDNRTLVGILQTNGALKLVMASGGEIVSVETRLQAVDGKYSFVLAVPGETRVVGLGDSVNYLRYQTPPLSYTITEASLDGRKLNFENSGGGSFLVGPDLRGSARNLNLYFAPVSNLDADGNGLADSWELKYFGALGVDPNADPDRDGKTNREEFIAGTDPKEATFLDISIVGVSPGKLLLSWESKPDHSYSVEKSAGIPFQNPTVVQQAILGQGKRISIQLDIDSGGKQTFFRLKE